MWEWWQTCKHADSCQSSASDRKLQCEETSSRQVWAEVSLSCVNGTKKSWKVFPSFRQRMSVKNHFHIMKPNDGEQVWTRVDLLRWVSAGQFASLSSAVCYLLTRASPEHLLGLWLGQKCQHRREKGMFWNDSRVSDARCETDAEQSSCSLNLVSLSLQTQLMLNFLTVDTKLAWRNYANTTPSLHFGNFCDHRRVKLVNRRTNQSFKEQLTFCSDDSLTSGNKLHVTEQDVQSPAVCFLSVSHDWNCSEFYANKMLQQIKWN